MRRRTGARLAWIAGVALFAGRTAAAEVIVAVNEGRVDLTARSAPLSDVLDRLARQTRMEVTYEGAPPRNLVTAAVQAATPAQAVLSVLEGLGVNYALQLDRTGREVRSILLVTAPAPAAAAGRPATGPSARLPPPPPPPDEGEDEPMVDEDEPALETRPERPFVPGGRMRPGRERAERPGAFEPTEPSQAVPFAPPATAPAYPVSPFAPVPVLPQTPAPLQPVPGQPQPVPQPQDPDS
jgi:hypothetical protein